MANRGGAPGGTRQRKHWHGTANASVAFTSASTAIIASLGITDPVTILRTLGSSLVSIGPALVADDRAVVTLGLGLVSTDAFVVGASAMPDPANEPEFDWLWWYAAHVHLPDVDQAGGVASAMRIAVNSKAMRRASHQETLVLIGQYENILGTPTVHVNASLRILIGE